MTEQVLVVEDQQEIAELICENLKELGLSPSFCLDGAEALEKINQQQFDLIILDVMLPKVTGLDICRQVREKMPEQAILMLTSRDSEMDRVLGLELGADDYMTKPFSIRELQARVRSLLRRVQLLTKVCDQQMANQFPDSHLNIGKLSIDNLSHRISYDGKNLELTATEYDLLHYLASHPDQVFSRSQLLSSVWGYHHSGYEHTVNSHINRLRSKIEENAADPNIVQTVWGVGYKFNPQGVVA